jgi:hypothetical protein
MQYEYLGKMEGCAVAEAVSRWLPITVAWA